MSAWPSAQARRASSAYVSPFSISTRLSSCKIAYLATYTCLSIPLLLRALLQLFHLPDHAPWSNFLNLLPPRNASTFASTPPTSSLAWAPASGRSFQLLASGSRDGQARVWKLHPPSLEGEEAHGVAAAGGSHDEWTGEMDVELNDGKSGRGGSVGSVKVEWNVTGTVLSTVSYSLRVSRASDHLNA